MIMGQKNLHWLGDSKKELSKFPEPVRSEIGYALYLSECGERHISAKAMTGIDAVEIVSDWSGDTFRGIYTTRFADTIFVLHCFQKKSKRGVKTPKRETDLIERRLKQAAEKYKELNRETK